jgi:hypothetical protein
MKFQSSLFGYRKVRPVFACKTQKRYSRVIQLELRQVQLYDFHSSRSF